MSVRQVLRKRPLRAILFTAVLFFCLGGISFAVSGGEHSSAEEHAPAKGWVATDTFRVLNFIVLAGALFFLLRKPMATALKSRVKGIQTQLEMLEQKKSEAEKQLAQYQEKLAQLDKEAERIVAEYIRQGQEARGRLIEEAKQASMRLEEQAQRTIEHEFKQAKLKLQAEIAEKALKKAEEAIKGRITTDDQERLVDEYLAKVVAS